MKGDFSRWDHDRKKNYAGVLHQQGRVLLDGDWNAQTRIDIDWQDRAARDTIGPGVAAVPVGERDSFKVKEAKLVSGKIRLKLAPGRTWADGLLISLPGPQDAERVASYLQPPIQTVPNPPANNDRDAVVLEVWREALNGFQVPDELIEPALGGPDTTERVQTAFALRLCRLAAGEDCHSIADKVKDDFGAKGKLKVTLQPTTTTPGDCPVVQGGGYTGFEHQLYRVEIANVAGGGPKFKWSQFNGGLVGRGVFHPPAGTEPAKVDIRANLQPIITSGLNDFYLEVVEHDSDLGHWRVTYGAKAALNNDNVLELAATTFGAIPPESVGGVENTVFFRLWNGIRAIAQFPKAVAPAEPMELRDGIRLEFDAAAGANYVPGDYWTFKVRAGDIGNPEVLIANQPPDGIHYHRVPLAVLRWDGSPNAIVTRDCRRVFRPLTRLDACCTFFVGDGLHSFGHFNGESSIMDALAALPDGEGQVCILPGLYTQNVEITHDNVTICGCGYRSKVKPLDPGKPVFTIHGCKNVCLEALAVSASVRSAIEAYDARYVTIRECRVEMADELSEWPGVFLVADDVLVENCSILLSPAPNWEAIRTSGAGYPKGPGGLQIGGTSDRVRIINNLIQGGCGNGITLGHVIEEGGGFFLLPQVWWLNLHDSCSTQGLVEIEMPLLIPWQEQKLVSGGPLYDIRIEHNRILDMGLNGIGVVAFFNLEKVRELATVDRLVIIENEIRSCVQRGISPVSADALFRKGYGGIALADAHHVVIRENDIEDNGKCHLEPVCGVFILHGADVDISDNRIMNNGPRRGVSDANAKTGLRGGIVVASSAKSADIRSFSQKYFTYGDSVPAVRIHDNTIVQALGKAIMVVALGPVSIVGNNLTSQGVGSMAAFGAVLSRLLAGTAGATDVMSLLDFLAGTVLVLDLGVSKDHARAAISQSAVAKTRRDKRDFPGKRTDTPDYGVLYQPGGSVLFASNQTLLDLRGEQVEFAISSQLICSLDDVACLGNQSECASVVDAVLLNTVALGVSVRVNDNRFQEGFTNTTYSLFSLGYLNTAATNQATHCLFVIGYRTEEPSNIVATDLFGRKCPRPLQLLKREYEIQDKTEAEVNKAPATS